MKHVPQYDQAWLEQASPTEITAARRAGQLASIQGQPIPIDVAAAVTTGEQLTEADVDQMEPEQIYAARKAGILDDLLAGKKS